MGVFWKYFRDELAWPLIRRTGVLAAVAKGLAGQLDQVRQDILWLRDQFNPATCELQYLDQYAQARGIRRHRLETAEQFRARVVAAYAWQLLGGRTGGVAKILQHYGFLGISIRNLRLEDPTRWAEFRVELDEPLRSYVAEDYELLAWLVNDQKPARSKLASLRIKRRGKTGLGHGMALRFQPRITIGPFDFTASVAPASACQGTGVAVASKITIG